MPDNHQQYNSVLTCDIGYMLMVSTSKPAELSLVVDVDGYTVIATFRFHVHLMIRFDEVKFGFANLVTDGGMIFAKYEVLVVKISGRYG